TRLLKGEAVEAVRALKAEDSKDIFVFGSANLLDSLLTAGLVDEYRICLEPVVLGGGSPLFKPRESELRMRLESARPLKIGGVVLTYRMGGSPHIPSPSDPALPLAMAGPNRLTGCGAPVWLISETLSDGVRLLRPWGRSARRRNGGRKMPAPSQIGCFHALHDADGPRRL